MRLWKNVSPGSLCSSKLKIPDGDMLINAKPKKETREEHETVFLKAFPTFQSSYFFVLSYFSLVPLLSLHLLSHPFLNLSLSLPLECRAMHICPGISPSPSPKLGTLCKSTLHPKDDPHRGHAEPDQRNWVLLYCTWPNVWSLFLHQKSSHTLSLEEKLPQAKPPSPCYRLLIAGHPGEDGGICTFDPNAARLGSLFFRLQESVGVCFRLWWHEKYLSKARRGCIGAWLRGSQCTGICFVCKSSIHFSYQHGCN